VRIVFDRSLFYVNSLNSAAKLLKHEQTMRAVREMLCLDENTVL